MNDLHIYTDPDGFLPQWAGAELSLTASDRCRGMSDSSSPSLPKHCNFSDANSHHILGGGTVLSREFTSKVLQYIYLPIHWEYEITQKVQWKQQYLHQNNSINAVSPASKVLLSAVGKRKNKQFTLSMVITAQGKHWIQLNKPLYLNLCT